MIDEWRAERGHGARTIRLFRGERLPAPTEPDLIVIMGGPMGVHDEAAYPWIREEKDFLREAAARGARMLGICLGAQLLADVLGGEVGRNPEREIGWYPIRPTEATAGSLLSGLPAGLTCFHWHGETFSVPPGAKLLAGSDACPNQAFQTGDRILGLQFHLESTERTVAALAENCADELVPGRFVTDRDRLLREAPRHLPAMNRLMRDVLDRLSET